MHPMNQKILTYFLPYPTLTFFINLIRIVSVIIVIVIVIVIIIVIIFIIIIIVIIIISSSIGGLLVATRIGIGTRAEPV